MDLYRKKNSIILWVKTKNEDFEVSKQFTPKIYAKKDLVTDNMVAEHMLEHKIRQRQDYLGKLVKVYELYPGIENFEKFVKDIETETRHKAVLYDADISPEQMYLYKNSISPFDLISEKLISYGFQTTNNLKKTNIEIKIKNDSIKSIKLNSRLIKGTEKQILEKFARDFISLNPDIISMYNAFKLLPALDEKLRKHNIYCPFHRWNNQPVNYRGGKTFYSYGSVSYHHFAVRLRGRLLLDTKTSIGSSCSPESIMELCNLSCNRFQHTASRSFGAVFQASLVKVMYQDNILIPYKEKPIDPPINLLQLLKSDRTGHIFDSETGMHKNIAEIDFCSMFPWLIYNKNISAETILSKSKYYNKAPGTHIKIAKQKKGLVPRAIKPFLDKRMHYKTTNSNKELVKGLKMVLVTSYGYLRFREFKLGTAFSHMAICAYAREIMLQAAKLAEQKGFTVVHGIIDSLYLKNVSRTKVKKFCSELEEITGIPVSFEGIFRWVVFLPSVNDKDRPVPTHYYGVYENQETKVRGLQLREKNTPYIVKELQEETINIMKNCKTKKEILHNLPKYCNLLRDKLKNLGSVEPEKLVCHIRVTKNDYKNNIVQKKVIEKLKTKGIEILPGDNIDYVYQDTGVVLAEDYNGKPNQNEYRKMLVKSLFKLLQPFDVSKQDIENLAQKHLQSKLDTYKTLNHYIPLKKTYKSRKGLSERLLKKRLEKAGWVVWRGGSINILEKEGLYPNVRKKYQQLIYLLKKHHGKEFDNLRYLCKVHHGMPDFICFRNSQFKFVECKLEYEKLSKRQVNCIKKLQQIGFSVEVHRVVSKSTLTRLAKINNETGDKQIIEKQAKISRFRSYKTPPG